MSNELEIAMNGKEAMNRVAMALGFTDAETDQAGITEAKKYISSVLQTVKNDPKGKLQKCDPGSIIDATIDAAKMKVAIDGRKHAALIPFYNKDLGRHIISLQITAAGYEAKLYEKLDRCVVLTGKVFKEDDFEKWTEDDYDHFTHRSADPFQDNPNEIRGIFVAISYFENNEKHQKVEILPKSELMKIMGCAKQDYVWNKWWLERATTAAIKRAAKRFFHKVTGLQELVDYDNKKNYSLEMDRRSHNNLIDNMNKQVKGEDLQIEDKAEPQAKTEIPASEPQLVPTNAASEQVHFEETKADVAEEKVDETGGGIF